MAEETNQEVQDLEEKPQDQDWQAKYEEMRGHMRDWEKKAKANQAAADELEKLKAEQMTEQEKANARAEAAESELAALRAEKAKREAAARIADESGVPVEMLMFCQDETAMEEFSKTYAKNAHTPSAPSASGASRIVRSDGQKPSNGEVFAELAQQLFN